MQSRAGPSACQASLSSLRVLGKGKALANRTGKGGKGLISLHTAVQVGDGLQPALFRMQEFCVCRLIGWLTGGNPCSHSLIKH